MIGLLTTALFVSHLAAQIPGGRLIDRVGAQRVGLASLAVIAAGNGIALTAARLPVGLTGRALMGLGTGAGFVAGLDLVRRGGGGPVWQGAYGGATMAGGGLALMTSRTRPTPRLARTLLDGDRARRCCVAPRARGRCRQGTPPRRPAERGLATGGCGRSERVQACDVRAGVVAGNWVVTLLEHEGHSRRASGLVGGLVLLRQESSRAPSAAGSCDGRPVCAGRSSR